MEQGTSLKQSLSRTGLSFLNLFWKNDGGRWDRSYAAGHWDFLDSLQQCPRHYVIAGMLRALGADASRVLDVGCGTGALVPHLPGNVSRYVGIDISSEAIRLCREKHADGAHRSFEASAFEGFECRETFQVIVFNEMLYYLPLPAIPDAVSRERTEARSSSPSTTGA